MRMVDLIEKKRDGYPLNHEEIRFMIEGYVRGEIPDYQMAAWAMAVYFQGMSKEETAYLTLCMAESGERVDLSRYGKRFVDKHSTGGVGDKTTLIVAPVVASCGVPVAKMSGRGLGHTGGTIDKLSSIPGFRVELSPSEFAEQIERIGLAVIAQTGNLVPADKLLYSLRDVTATVDSIPLIASSVMSKKIAAGAHGIVLDVKYGSGAFMKNKEKAIELAQAMVEIGKNAQRETVAVISSMEQPLGRAVGNSLEVLEAVQTLKGKGPEDLRQLCVELAAWMVVVGKENTGIEEARFQVERALNDGSALNKFLKFVAAQGGDPETIQRENLPVAPEVSEIYAPEDGFIGHIDARKIGVAAMHLGAGRATKDSPIDLGAGLLLFKKQGERVIKGEPIARLYSSDRQKMAIGLEIAAQSFTIENSPVSPGELIADIIR